VAEIDVFAVSGRRDSARGAPEIARTPASARAPVATIHPRHFAVFFSFMTFLLGEEKEGQAARQGNADSSS